MPRAGSGYQIIDLIRFLAGCRKRRLNQALSCPGSLLRVFTGAALIVFGYFVFSRALSLGCFGLVVSTSVSDCE